MFIFSLAAHSTLLLITKTTAVLDSNTTSRELSLLKKKSF